MESGYNIIGSKYMEYVGSVCVDVYIYMYYYIVIYIYTHTCIYPKTPCLPQGEPFRSTLSAWFWGILERLIS